MPTWMLREDNARARAASRAALDPEALEWMNLFEEGDGFRVRLRPHLDVSIRNTFSQLPRSLEERYRVQTNHLGFRGPELGTPKDPKTFRVIVFGDSSSFGWGVHQHQMFSSRLADTLNALPLDQRPRQKAHIEVGNFAIPGDSSEYGSLIFEHFAARYQPDLVILGFGANDAKQVVTPHQSEVEKFRRSGWSNQIRAALSSSALVRTLLRFSQRRGPQADTPTTFVTAVERKRYRANLARMAESAARIGAHTLVISLCTPLPYRRTAEALSHRRGLIHVDGQRLLLEAVPALRSKRLYPEEVSQLEGQLGTLLEEQPLLYVSSDGCHPNALGHMLVAKSLVDAILEFDWSTPPGMGFTQGTEEL
jgi:lysophospholipase L1-like esterase